MFHKVKEVVPLQDMRLCVRFANGSTKEYDVEKLVSRFPQFAVLEDEHLFEEVQVDVGGYGIVWNNDLDLSCDELWKNGVDVQTPFDGLMAFSDASELWGLSESALRKAVAYGKIEAGIDARKFGKQWVVTQEAMRREYGNPVEVLRLFRCVVIARRGFGFCWPEQGGSTIGVTLLNFAMLLRSLSNERRS